MIPSLLATALAGTATLHVGVHVAAGSVYDIAADGADGLCTVGPARVSCPASGPVTFRWGPGGPWILSGDTVVAPGEVGVAFVLATEEARVAEREALAARSLDPEVVRRLFLRTGDAEPPPPSRGMIDDLVALAEHPDPRVRRAVVDALAPLWRHTASDPFPPSAPELVPTELIGAFADDRDPRVRRRLASRLRDLRDPSEALAEEAFDALTSLVADDRASVQRAAIATATSSDVAVPAELSWAMALENVSTPGPPGRAAANTLARLRPHLDPERVDAAEAVHLVLQHHPERAWRVWSAWRTEVPFRRAWVDQLLRETVGLDPRLLRHWAAVAPGALGEALADWEPAPPHSDRWGVVRSWLSDTEDASLRRVLGLAEPPSVDSGPRAPRASDNLSESRVGAGRE